MILKQPPDTLQKHCYTFASFDDHLQTIPGGATAYLGGATAYLVGGATAYLGGATAYLVG